MTPLLKIRRDERGALLLQAALAILALLAITTFVVDYGVLWLGRGQAQNAADAGALAGAVALGLDSRGMSDFTAAGPARQSAYRLAHANWIVGQSPASDIATDITVEGPTQPTHCPAPWSAYTCVRVDVYRDQERGNPLPMIFGSLVGLTMQGVRATATALAVPGNTSSCLKPWVVVDRWQENSKPPNTTFNPGVDVYVPPSPAGPGTGYNVQDVGTSFVIKSGSPGGAITTSWYSPVDLPLPPSGNPVTGGAQYRTNIFTCTEWPVKIGDLLPPENGNMVGPTKQGVDDLVALDPSASWKTSTKTVINSCAPGVCADGQYHDISPRIVALAVVDPNVLAAGPQHGKGIQLQVTNILGFFINGMQGNDVTGYLTVMPGQTIGAPTTGPGSAFLTSPIFIR